MRGTPKCHFPVGVDKERREKETFQGWAGPTLNPEVSAQRRLSQVNIFDFNLNIIDLTFRLLRAMELAAGPQV